VCVARNEYEKKEKKKEKAQQKYYDLS